MKIGHRGFSEQPSQRARAQDVSSRSGRIGWVDETGGTGAYRSLRVFDIDVGGDDDGPSLSEEPDDLPSHLAGTDDTDRPSLELCSFNWQK